MNQPGGGRQDGRAVRRASISAFERCHISIEWPFAARRRQHARSQRPDARGAALILVVVSTAVLSAVGAILVVIARTESAIAVSHERAYLARYAAEGAVELAAQLIAREDRWSMVLSGVATGPLGGAGVGLEPAGDPQMSLLARTRALQRRTDGRLRGAGDGPRWTLYLHGDLHRLLGVARGNAAPHVAVWVSDDPADLDGDPTTDHNGILQLHAEALLGSALRVVEVVLKRVSCCPAVGEGDAPGRSGEGERTSRDAVVVLRYSAEGG